MPSPSPAHRRKVKKRKQILPWWLLLIIIILAVALLVIFNPEEKSLTNSAANQGANEVTLRYLENLLVNSPNDKSIKLKIIEQHIGLGNLKTAAEQLRPFLLLPRTNKYYWQAQWLIYQLTYANAIEILRKQQKDQKVLKIVFPLQTKERLLTQMKQLSNAPLSPVQLAIIAKRSLEMENPTMAKDIYQRLAKIKPPKDPKVLDNYAKVAIYASAYEIAADYYFQAQQYSRNLNDKRKYFLLALQSLLYGDKAKQAIAIAPKKIGKLKNDKEVLTYLARLALGGQQPKIALMYIKQVLYEKKDKTTQTEMVPYDEEIYLLAYQIFLADQQVEQAFMLATAVVDQQPDNMSWRRRLAGIAAWAGHPGAGMTQWAYIAKQTGDIDDINQVINIANAFHNDPLLIEFLNIKMQHYPDDQAIEVEWIAAMEREGRAKEAITVLLNKQRQSNSRDQQKFYDQQLIRLYHRTGQSAKELAMLQQIQKTYGGSADNALKQANIYFNRGDINASLTVMQSVIDIVPATESEYWHTLANLAWMLNTDQIALKAYTVLYQQQQATAGEMQNFVTLLQKEQPQKAFAIALSGWQQTNSPALFFQLAAIAQQLDQWSQLAAVLKDMTPEQQQALEKNLYFWQLRPYIWQKIGDQQQALHAYQLAIKQFPDNQSLKAAYLWYLISEKNNHALRQFVLSTWQTPNLSDELKNAYAVAALQIEQPRLAVAIYHQQMQEKKDDINFLINYAYALEQANMTGMATTVRDRAWYLLNQNRDALDDKQLNYLANLALQRHAVDRALPILAKLAYQQQNIAAIQALIDWAISKQYYDLAIYLRNYYRNQEEAIPDYAEMSLALVENDRQKISEQLEKDLKKDALPSSDDVVAAERLGQMSLARKLAYQRLEAHPDDHNTYMALQRILLKMANILTFNQEYETADNLTGPLTKVNSHFYINHRWSVDIGAQAWLIENQDETKMLNAPALDTQGQILIARNDNHGHGNFTTGYRYALKGFPFASLVYFHQLNARTSIDGYLGINDRANQSIPLRVAGMEDQIRLRASYQLTARSRLVNTVTTERFYGQDRSYLGYGYGNLFQWQYLLRQRYPDIGISPFYNWHHYNADGSVNATMAKLVPSEMTPDATFYVPYSLRQYGAFLSYGESQRNLYTNRWRPFFSTSIFRTISQGSGTLGYLFSGGIAGGLFGCDNLSLYGQYSLGEQQADQKFYLIGLQYKYYF